MQKKYIQVSPYIKFSAEEKIDRAASRRTGSARAALSKFWYSDRATRTRSIVRQCLEFPRTGKEENGGNAGDGERTSLFPFVAKSSRTALACARIAEERRVSAIELQKRGPRDKRESAYNGIDEAIILRANEHYCQRDVDKNGRANHEIPRGLRSRRGPARI